MKTRLTSLVLVLLLSGSAFAGVSWQLGEHSCSMEHSIGGLDCCKAALMEGQAPQASIARLCCALNCSKEGMAPTNGAKFSPRLQFATSINPAIPSVLLNTQVLTRFSSSHRPQSCSQPAYILNLALLI